jgi:hypothetical protein
VEAELLMHLERARAVNAPLSHRTESEAFLYIDSVSDTLGGRGNLTCSRSLIMSKACWSLCRLGFNWSADRPKGRLLDHTVGAYTRDVPSRCRVTVEYKVLRKASPTPQPALEPLGPNAASCCCA